MTTCAQRRQLSLLAGRLLSSRSRLRLRYRPQCPLWTCTRRTCTAGCLRRVRPSRSLLHRRNSRRPNSNGTGRVQSRSRITLRDRHRPRKPSRPRLCLPRRTTMTCPHRSSRNRSRQVDNRRRSRLRRRPLADRPPDQGSRPFCTGCSRHELLLPPGSAESRRDRTRTACRLPSRPAARPWSRGNPSASSLQHIRSLVAHLCPSGLYPDLFCAPP